MTQIVLQCTCPDRQCRGTMTFTEGREPTGLAMENLSRVLGDVQRSPPEIMT